MSITRPCAAAHSRWPRRSVQGLRALCGSLALTLLLAGCGGGGGDDGTSPPAATDNGNGGGGGGNGSAPPVSDLALYQYYVSTDTAGYGCAVNSYWRDCDAFYNGLAYFDTYCARGHAQSCQYSQLLQGNYMSYRLARSPRG